MRKNNITQPTGKGSEMKEATKTVYMLLGELTLFKTTDISTHTTRTVICLSYLSTDLLLKLPPHTQCCAKLLAPARAKGHDTNRCTSQRVSSAQ